MRIQPIHILVLGLIFAVIFVASIAGLRLVKIFFRRWNKGEELPTSDHLLVGALREQVAHVRATENQLNESRQAYRDLFTLYQTIMEQMPLGLIEMDESWRINYANPAATHLLATLKESSNLREASPELFERLNSLRSEGKVHAQIELSCPNLLNRVLMVSLTELPNSRWLSTMSDQTELNHLEQRLQANRELTLMGEMASGIAHEVKNVLGVILARTQMMRLESDEESEHLTAITDESERLVKVARQFMNSSRDEQPECVRVKLSQWFDEMAATWATRGHGDGLVFENNCPHIDVVFWDPVMLSLAINNLIDNAIDANALVAQNDKVVVNLRAIQGDVCIQVVDSGPGFTQNVQEKLFVPFVTSKAQGTGLGLFHSRNIVLAHGGRIEVSQKPTRVSCYLPVDNEIGVDFHHGNEDA